MLPAKWRKQQGIQPETELLLELRENCLVLQTREQAVCEAQQMVRKLVPPGKSLVDDLLEERRREALQEQAGAGRNLSPGKRPLGGRAGRRSTGEKRRRAKVRR